MQMIPLLLKRHDVKDLNKAITKFLWQAKKPRINMNRLCLPKAEGGMNLPNIRHYNTACLLRHVCDWISGSSQYSNYTLEQAWAEPWDLSALIHTPPSSSTTTDKEPPAIQRHSICVEGYKKTPTLADLNFQIYSIPEKPCIPACSAR